MGTLKRSAIVICIYTGCPRSSGMINLSFNGTSNEHARLNPTYNRHPPSWPAFSLSPLTHPLPPSPTPVPPFFSRPFDETERGKFSRFNFHARSHESRWYIPTGSPRGKIINSFVSYTIFAMDLNRARECRNFRKNLRDPRSHSPRLNFDRISSIIQRTCDACPDWIMALGYNQKGKKETRKSERR
jgi:hypothetical protein